MCDPPATQETTTTTTLSTSTVADNGSRNTEDNKSFASSSSGSNKSYSSAKMEAQSQIVAARTIIGQAIYCRRWVHQWKLFSKWNKSFSVLTEEQ